ncbi:MAG: hypothetical protein OJF51_004136 [Nitrospira sp.]|nr:MAG: hypothetical protein OJF51_004136 [Nitrospira sp.]
MGTLLFQEQISCKMDSVAALLSCDSKIVTCWSVAKTMAMCGSPHFPLLMAVSTLERTGW